MTPGSRGKDDLTSIMDSLCAPGALPTDPQLVRIRETVPEFTEQCPKCRGSGRFVSWSGRTLGQCFSCKGKGSNSFKSSPEQRAASREKAAVRKVTQAEGNWEAVVRNGLAREAEWAAKKVAPTAKVDASKIVEAFQRARQAGLEDVKLRFDGITMKPAQFDRTGNTLLVKAGTLRIGKIEAGTFVPFRVCTPEQTAQVVAICLDLEAAAQAYGFATSKCGVCGRKLTNQESIETGIGPICAGRMGWTPGRLKVAAPQF